MKIFKTKKSKIVFASALSALSLLAGGILIGNEAGNNIASADSCYFDAQGGQMYPIRNISSHISDQGYDGYDADDNWDDYEYLYDDYDGDYINGSAENCYLLKAGGDISWMTCDFTTGAFELHIKVKTLAGENVSSDCVEYIICDDIYTYAETGMGASLYYGQREWNWMSTSSTQVDMVITNHSNQDLILENVWMLDGSSYNPGSAGYLTESGVTVNPSYYGRAQVDIPKRTGYKFAGWYTEPEGQGDYVDISINNIQHAIYHHNSYGTLYANWTPNQYSVTLNHQNGEENTVATATYGSVLTVDVPIKAGRTFAGYFTSATGGTQYIDSAGVGVSPWGRTSAVTLYARWVSDWTGLAQKPSGTGIEDDPFLIATPNNLAWVAQKINVGTPSAGVYFKQTRNIDLAGIDWQPIGTKAQPFCGSYDGGYYKISNLSTNSGRNSTGTYTVMQGGLFGAIASGTSSSNILYSAKLSNICVESGSIYGSVAGGIVAYVEGYNGVEITNCTNNADVYGYSHAGGIVGESMGVNITKCTNLGNVEGQIETAGGIIGFSTGNLIIPNTYNNVISECTSVANITGSQFVGGILGGGQFGLAIERCYVAGIITVSNLAGGNAGGFIGRAGCVAGRMPIGYTITHSMFEGKVVSATLSCAIDVGYVHGSTEVLVYDSIFKAPEQNLGLHRNKDGVILENLSGRYFYPPSNVTSITGEWDGWKIFNDVPINELFQMLPYGEKLTTQTLINLGYTKG